MGRAAACGPVLKWIRLQLAADGKEVRHSVGKLEYVAYLDGLVHRVRVFFADAEVDGGHAHEVAVEADVAGGVEHADGCRQIRVDGGLMELLNQRIFHVGHTGHDVEGELNLVMTGKIRIGGQLVFDALALDGVDVVVCAGEHAVDHLRERFGRDGCGPVAGVDHADVQRGNLVLKVLDRMVLEPCAVFCVGLADVLNGLLQVIVGAGELLLLAVARMAGNARAGDARPDAAAAGVHQKAFVAVEHQRALALFLRVAHSPQRAVAADFLFHDQMADDVERELHIVLGQILERAVDGRDMALVVVNAEAVDAVVVIGVRRHQIGGAGHNGVDVGVDVDRRLFARALPGRDDVEVAGVVVCKVGARIPIGVVHDGVVQILALNNDAGELEKLLVDIFARFLFVTGDGRDRGEVEQEFEHVLLHGLEVGSAEIVGLHGFHSFIIKQSENKKDFLGYIAIITRFYDLL